MLIFFDSLLNPLFCVAPVASKLTGPSKKKLPAIGDPRPTVAANDETLNPVIGGGALTNGDAASRNLEGCTYSRNV